MLGLLFMRIHRRSKCGCCCFFISFRSVPSPEKKKLFVWKMIGVWIKHDMNCKCSARVHQERRHILLHRLPLLSCPALAFAINEDIFSSSLRLMTKYRFFLTFYFKLLLSADRILMKMEYFGIINTKFHNNRLGCGRWKSIDSAAASLAASPSRSTALKESVVNVEVDVSISSARRLRVSWA